MSEVFTTAVLVAVGASAIRLAVPLLLAALGETFGQRSGVLNLGVDGIMLLGAFTGYYAVLKTDNVWLGLLAGALVGLVLGLASAVIAVTLKAEQGISGIGIFLFGLGMSDLLFQKLVGCSGSSASSSSPNSSVPVVPSARVSPETPSTVTSNTSAPVGLFVTGAT